MQADLLLVAVLLRRGRSLDHCSAALSLVAVLFGLAPWLGAPASPALALICGALLITGLAEAGEKLDDQTHALDQALQNLGLQNAQQGSRTWHVRCHGALRLLRKQALCLLLQIVIVILGIFIALA
mgnify:CR=1 FL=1